MNLYEYKSLQQFKKHYEVASGITDIKIQL